MAPGRSPPLGCWGWSGSSDQQGSKHQVWRGWWALVVMEAEQVAWPWELLGDRTSLGQGQPWADHRTVLVWEPQPWVVVGRTGPGWSQGPYLKWYTTWRAKDSVLWQPSFIPLFTASSLFWPSYVWPSISIIPVLTKTASQVLPNASSIILIPSQFWPKYQPESDQFLPTEAGLPGTSQ